MMSKNIPGVDKVCMLQVIMRRFPLYRFSCYCFFLSVVVMISWTLRQTALRNRFLPMEDLPFFNMMVESNSEFSGDKLDHKETTFNQINLDLDAVNPRNVFAAPKLYPKTKLVSLHHRVKPFFKIFLNVNNAYVVLVTTRMTKLN